MNDIDDAYEKFKKESNPQAKFTYFTAYMFLKHDRGINLLWLCIFIQMVMITWLVAKS